MRRLIVSALSAAMSLFIVNPARAVTITGNANNAQGQDLANYTVRLRNVATGELTGSTRSGATGQRSFTGLTPGTYVVEIVNQAGEIIGTSSAFSVAEGAATVKIVATGAAAAAAATGGTPFFTSMAGNVNNAAAAAHVVGVVVPANRNNASPSR